MTTTTTQTITERLRGYRLSRGLTQAQLAAQLGVRLNTLSRWEEGIRRPRGLYYALVERFLATEENKP